MHRFTPFEAIRRSGTHFGASQERAFAFDAARQQWPSVKLSFDDFSQHLDRLGHVNSLPAHVSAVYLCAACAQGMNAACAALDRAYFPSLRSSLASRWRHSDFADEVLQQARERLFGGPTPKIATYRGNGTLSAWLRTITSHLAMDNCRRAPRTDRLSLHEWKAIAETSAGDKDPCSALGMIRSSQATVAVAIEGILRESVARLDTSERQLLGSFYFAALGVEEIAQRRGIDRSTVYRRLRRAERRLAQATSRLLRTRLRISDPDEHRVLLRDLSAYVSLHEAFTG